MGSITRAASCHHNPFSLNPHTIVAILHVPIDILRTDTIGKSAAQSVFARKSAENWRSGRRHARMSGLERTQ